LELGNVGSVNFRKDRSDGRYYLESTDETFEYWHSCFACFGPPSVMLRWVPAGEREGTFRIALDKMKGPPPTPKEWEEDFVVPAKEAFNPDNIFGIVEPRYFAGPGLWSSMLDLIYSSRSSLAWKLLNEVWPPNKPGKEQFLTDFCSQLKTSPYWLDLKLTMLDAPRACVLANPRGTD
jgi:hypothetical protein